MQGARDLLGAVLVLTLSINFSLQQTCSPTQFKCISGECIDSNFECDYSSNCPDRSDEANCTYPSADRTKALVLLYRDEGAMPNDSLVNWFGDPAQYVPLLGFASTPPAANLSLPLGIDSYSFPNRDYIESIAVDSHNSLVFYGNNARQRVEWGAFLNGNFTTAYIADDITSSQIVAVAYDWIAKNIYWLESLDADNSLIHVATVGLPSGSVYTRTILSNYGYPTQDIAVDPVNGWLFWIGGTGATTVITQYLMGSYSFYDPYSSYAYNYNCIYKLSIDVNSQHLYWLDATNTRVCSASYSNGLGPNEICYTSSEFGNMSSLTLFGDYVVLGSATQRTINFYKKDNMTFVASSALVNKTLVDVATFDKGSQPINGSNSPCLVDNGGCSELCFPTSLSTAICGCRSNYSLNIDGKTCSYAPECEFYGAQCSNGDCLYRNFVCDHYIDCSDKSDESNCDYPPVDKTKALVLSTNIDGLVIYYGDPAEYVPLLSQANDIGNLPVNFYSYSVEIYGSIAAIDIDSHNALVLFGNNVRQQLEWGEFLTGNSSSFFITGNLTSAEIAAVAYDWVAKNVYWLDVGYRWIGVASIGSPYGNVSTKTVVENIVNPQDIAVDPVIGWLFWIEGTCGSARIMRSRLDGYNPTPINMSSIPSGNCPSKLAIDVISQQLYWLDAENTRLGFMSYGSSSAANWITLPEFSKPTAITIFGNYVVLSSTNGTDFYNRETLKLEASLGLESGFVSDLATYDIASQPIINDHGINSAHDNRYHKHAMICVSAVIAYLSSFQLM